MRRFLREFMAGRYGVDKLSIALIFSGFIFNIVISFLRLPFLSLIRFEPAVYIVFRLLGFLPYIPYGIAFYRILSRNFERRRREEAAFMKVADKWIKYFSRKIRQYKDKEHRYFDCPRCHRTLRVPKGRGKIKIDCPHCGRQFNKRT